MGSRGKRATFEDARRWLAEFLPRAGSTYTAERNYDLGDVARNNVSCLSPFVRHGLLYEEEVIRAVLDRHSSDQARKFIEEVCWRTYFKGWLELRAEVWRRYRDELRRTMALCDEDSDLDRRCHEAIEGRTGIDCFDHWARELIATNYLHNHARMWFASIWIFTLRLPWVLGADFFLRHLLDGDAASNTLSWRWVGGLHTRGKIYLATSPNITKFSGGRFPRTEGLTTEAVALREAPLPAAQPLEILLSPEPDRPTGLLITDDDCQGGRVLHETSLTPCACAGVICADERSPLPVAASVRRFTEEALRDGLARTSDRYVVPTALVTPSQIPAWAEAHGLRQIVMRYVPQGPSRDVLCGIRPELEARGIRMVEVRRAWDEAFWPHCNAGYFSVKKRIPSVLRGSGIPCQRIRW
ncbi:MAG: FAD-binding domain-containing protein [Pseudomonadota bacterium]